MVFVQSAADFLMRVLDVMCKSNWANGWVLFLALKMANNFW
jgi:hypothetical protein